MYRLKKATKVNGIWKYGHTKQYFNDNNFLTVYNIYTYSTLVETFKILRAKEPSSIYTDTGVFTISKLDVTRLITPICRLTAYSSNYYYKAPKLWNAVKNFNIIKHFSIFTLTYFKRNLKLYLINMQQKFDVNVWHDYNNDFLNFIVYQKNNPYHYFFFDSCLNFFILV